jgi:biotin transporter BioY
METNLYLNTIFGYIIQNAIAFFLYGWIANVVINWVDVSILTLIMIVATVLVIALVDPRN